MLLSSAVYILPTSRTKNNHLYYFSITIDTSLYHTPLGQEMPPLTPHSCQTAATAAKLAAATNAALSPSCRCHRQAGRRRQHCALAKLPPPLPSWSLPPRPRSPLSPRFHRRRRPLCFHCHRSRCHCCRFCCRYHCCF